MGAFQYICAVDAQRLTRVVLSFPGPLTTFFLPHIHIPSVMLVQAAGMALPLGPALDWKREFISHL